MPNINQIYDVVNSLAEQSMGMTGLTATNASFVSVGEQVFSSDKNTDAFYKVLLDRIGRVVVSMRKYYPTGRNLRREPIEWGMALQKLTVPLISAVENTTWDKQDEEHADPFKKNPIAVNQKIFSKLATWEDDNTLPDVQLKTAFTNPTAMASYFESLLLSAENSLALQVQSLNSLCRGSFMARKMKQGGMHHIDLLYDYNTETSSTLTSTNCRYSQDFLRYSAMIVSLMATYLRDMSVVFSDGVLPRHTPTDMQCLDVLADFSKRMAFYLQADTYHRELVTMPGFEEVSFWQASGALYNFSDISSINLSYQNIAEDGTTENVEVQESNIVAVLYDWESMGTTINNRRTKSIYNPKGEYTNYFHKADIGYFNDISENGIVFTINGENPNPTPEGQPEPQAETQAETPKKQKSK